MLGRIPFLGEMLRLSERFVCYQGTVCDSIVGLCIFLKRLSYPCRYSDLIYLFGKPVPVLSMIHDEVIDFIAAPHSPRITRWNDTIFHPRNLQIYADAIHSKGGALDNCCSFIRDSSTNMSPQ